MKETWNVATGCYVNVFNVVGCEVLIVVNEPNGILSKDEFILVSSVAESVLREAYEDGVTKKEMYRRLDEVLENLDCLCFGYQLYGKWNVIK